MPWKRLGPVDEGVCTGGDVTAEEASGADWICTAGVGAGCEDA